MENTETHRGLRSCKASSPGTVRQVTHSRATVGTSHPAVFCRVPSPAPPTSEAGAAPAPPARLASHPAAPESPLRTRLSHGHLGRRCRRAQPGQPASPFFMETDSPHHGPRGPTPRKGKLPQTPQLSHGGGRAGAFAFAPGPVLTPRRAGAPGPYVLEPVEGSRMWLRGLGTRRREPSGTAGAQKGREGPRPHAADFARSSGVPGRADGPRPTSRPSALHPWARGAAARGHAPPTRVRPEENQPGQRACSQDRAQHGWDDEKAACGDTSGPETRAREQSQPAAGACPGGTALTP